MATISYNDTTLTYLGRWTDYSTNTGSGWQGTQVRFKVSGASQLSINCDVSDLYNYDTTFAVINIDDGEWQLQRFTEIAEIFIGNRTVDFSLPNTNEHEILLKIGMFPVNQWAGNGYIRLKELTVDSGSFSAWLQYTAKHTGCVGDSWMGAQYDWPRLMNQKRYWLYPISFGGAKASDLDTQFNFDYSGIPNTSDPTLDLVIVNSSVNDYLNSVPIASFDISFASLVDKIRTKQPTAKVIAIQSPRNTRDSLNYDQYGPGMQTIISTRPNMYYIESPSSLWSQLTWEIGDGAHLDYNGRVLLASYIQGEIDKLYPKPSASVHIVT